MQVHRYGCVWGKRRARNVEQRGDLEAAPDQIILVASRRFYASRGSAERALRDVPRDEPSWIGAVSVKRFPLVDLSLN
jgi:hypothetical protein